MADARQDAKSAMTQLRQGIDPVLARKREKAIKAGNTFRVVAGEWFGQQEGRWSEDHANRVWDYLKADVFPLIGARI